MPEINWIVDRVIKNTEIKLYVKGRREFFLSSPIPIKAKSKLINKKFLFYGNFSNFPLPHF